MPITDSRPRRPSARPDPDDPARSYARALEHLYDAFRPIPFDPAMFRVIGSTMPDQVERLGGAVPELPADLLGRFVLKVGTTWGGPGDLRRVTPRLLELAADHLLPVDRALLWSKLAWADWQNWPTHQARMMREFCHAEWRRLLASPPRPAHLAHRWLEHAVHGVGDIGPFLDTWRRELQTVDDSAHHRAVTGHLVLLLTNSPLRPDFPNTVDRLFPAHPAAADRLRGFLVDDRIRELLDASAVQLASTSDARRIRTALGRLDRLRTRLLAPDRPDTERRPTGT